MRGCGSTVHRAVHSDVLVLTPCQVGEEPLNLQQYQAVRQHGSKPPTPHAGPQPNQRQLPFHRPPLLIPPTAPWGGAPQVGGLHEAGG